MYKQPNRHIRARGPLAQRTSTRDHRREQRVYQTVDVQHIRLPEAPSRSKRLLRQQAAQAALA